MDALVTGVCAAGGLVLGEAVEVVVERVGARRPLTRPWQACGECDRPLGAAAGAPVVGSLLVRRCPHCAAPRAHGHRALVLGVVSAVVLGLLGGRFGADTVLAAYAVLGLSLVALSAVDLERYILPNRILYPTVAVTGPLLVIASAVDHRWGSLGRAALSAAVAFVAFLAVHLAVPRGMGFGDVRLAGLVGGAAGWLGFGHAFVAFLVAFGLGAVIGLVVMAVTRGGRKTRVPFGPFLAAGALVALVWGSPIANALFHRGS